MCRNVGLERLTASICGALRSPDGPRSGSRSRPHAGLIPMIVWLSGNNPRYLSQVCLLLFEECCDF